MIIIDLLLHNILLLCYNSISTILSHIIIITIHIYITTNINILNTIDITAITINIITINIITNMIE